MVLNIAIYHDLKLIITLWMSLSSTDEDARLPVHLELSGPWRLEIHAGANGEPSHFSPKAPICKGFGAAAAAASICPQVISLAKVGKPWQIALVETSRGGL